MPGNMGNVRPPPMVYQHTHVPLHVPTDQIEQQSTSSQDQDSSSDDDSDINMLGTTHAYQLCNMPIEGTTIINQPQIHGTNIRGNFHANPQQNQEKFLAEPVF